MNQTYTVRLGAALVAHLQDYKQSSSFYPKLKAGANTLTHSECVELANELDYRITCWDWEYPTELGLVRSHKLAYAQVEQFMTEKV